MRTITIKSSIFHEESERNVNFQKKLKVDGVGIIYNLTKKEDEYKGSLEKKSSRILLLSLLIIKHGLPKYFTKYT